MSEPAGVPEGGAGPIAAAPVAVARGLLVFVAVALAGQVPPLLIRLFGGGLAWVTAWRVGWLYTLSFNRVAIEIQGLSLPDRHVFQVVHVTVALLTGTALALWLLYRAGRAVGLATGGGAAWRAAAGATVAIPYAVPIFLLSLVVRLELETGGGFLPDITTFAGVPWQAIAMPSAIGVLAGGAGGLLTSEALDRRVRSWLVGGFQTFVTALGLAFVGLLVFAAVQPSGTAAYARALGSPRQAALIAGNQALGLPSHAMSVLVPSMGGCVSLRGVEAAADLLCMGRFPLGDPGDRFLGVVSDVARGGEPASPTRPMRSLAPFFLVPLLATLAGGRLAARGWSAGRDRLVAALGAGVVFSVLVSVGAWASSIVLTGRNVGLAADEQVRVVLGPPALVAGTLALAWGVVGGVLGALLPDRSQVPGVGVPPAGDAGDGPASPPSPTSV